MLLGSIEFVGFIGFIGLTASTELQVALSDKSPLSQSKSAITSFLNFSALNSGIHLGFVCSLRRLGVENVHHVAAQHSERIGEEKDADCDEEEAAYKNDHLHVAPDLLKSGQEQIEGE